MKITKNSLDQRYLPHDPRLETEDTSSANTKKTESSTMDSKLPEDNVDIEVLTLYKQVFTFLVS